MSRDPRVEYIVLNLDTSKADEAADELTRLGCTVTQLVVEGINVFRVSDGERDYEVTWKPEPAPPEASPASATSEQTATPEPVDPNTLGALPTVSVSDKKPSKK